MESFMVKIERMEANARGVLAGLDEEKLAKLEESSTMESDMLFEFQQAQSFLFASGKIPQDAAQFVYASVGEAADPGHWMTLPLERRLVLMQVFAQMMELKIDMLANPNQEAVS